MEPHRQCKHKGNDTRRLKWAGVTPKYNYRYADDWVILTSTEKEALRLKRVLTNISEQNETRIVAGKDLCNRPADKRYTLSWLCGKGRTKRKTPDPATWTKHLVGKPLPDMERLGKKIKKLLEEVHRIELVKSQCAGCANSVRQLCHYGYGTVLADIHLLSCLPCDRPQSKQRCTDCMEKLYPKRYNSMQVPLKVLCNLPDRHKGYDSKTFAVWVEGKWFGITYAFITHSHYEPKPFDQK